MQSSHCLSLVTDSLECASFYTHYREGVILIPDQFLYYHSVSAAFLDVKTAFLSFVDLHNI